MSAAMTAPQQIDGLEKLLTLANLKPDVIRATQEELRSQLQLTAEEKEKVGVARAYIAQHATLAANLNAREEALTAEKNAHLQAVESHKAHVAAENLRLETFSATVDERNRKSEELAKKLETDKNNFSGLKLDHERAYRDAMASSQKIQAEADAGIQANAVESERLKQWEATLKRKAELVRQQMANF